MTLNEVVGQRFQFVKDDIKWVKYSLVFVTIYNITYMIYNILMFKKISKLMLITKL